MQEITGCWSYNNVRYYDCKILPLLSHINSLCDLRKIDSTAHNLPALLCGCHSLLHLKPDLSPPDISYWISLDRDVYHVDLQVATASFCPLPWCLKSYIFQTAWPLLIQYHVLIALTCKSHCMHLLSYADIPIMELVVSWLDLIFCYLQQPIAWLYSMGNNYCREI